MFQQKFGMMVLRNVEGERVLVAARVEWFDDGQVCRDILDKIR